MAGRKKAVKTVKMFGTGNFVIGETLYAFRDGEEVTVQDESHIPLLEAEAARREANTIRTYKLTEEQRTKRD